MAQKPRLSNAKKLGLWPAKAKSFSIKPPFVLLHGGLGDAAGEKKVSFMEALRSIAEKIQREILKNKIDALDLALFGAYQLEEHPIFNAGRGSKLQKDGSARLSAGLMDGKIERLAAVSNLESILHPSLVARRLLKENDRTLASFEANRFAFREGFYPEDLRTPARIAEWKAGKVGTSGTIGCLALDRAKKTAACTSTGGKGNELPGRVSDSFTPAGNFANAFGAASCTGTGEDILEAAAACSVVTRLEDGFSLTDSMSKTFRRHRFRDFGVIALSAKGEACVHATSGSMSFALITPSKFWIGVTKEEWSKVKAPKIPEISC